MPAVAQAHGIVQNLPPTATGGFGPQPPSAALAVAPLAVVSWENVNRMGRSLG